MDCRKALYEEVNQCLQSPMRHSKVGPAAAEPERKFDNPMSKGRTDPSTPLRPLDPSMSKGRTDPSTLRTSTPLCQKVGPTPRPYAMQPA